MLGGFDSSLTKGEMNYHKVVDEYYWTVKADKILVGGEDIGVCRNCRVVVDTGTSLITGPSKELMTLLSKIKVDDRCSNMNELPAITFVIDGIDYTLTS